MPGCLRGGGGGGGDGELAQEQEREERERKAKAPHLHAVGSRATDRFKRREAHQQVREELENRMDTVGVPMSTVNRDIRGVLDPSVTLFLKYIFSFKKCTFVYN